MEPSLSPPPQNSNAPVAQTDNSLKRNIVRGGWKNQKKISFITKVLGTLLLPLVGVIVAFSLTRTNQDLRQQASEGPYGVVAENTGKGNGECLAPGESCQGGTSAFDASCPVTETRCGSQTRQEMVVKVAVKDGECLGHNQGGEEQTCEGGSGYVDLTCGGRNYRCGARPSPSPTPPSSTPVDKCSVQQHLNCTFGCDSTTGQCKQGKANNEACSNNGECNSLNCVATPGGKFCLEAGTTLSPLVAEGGVCGTTAYNRECQTGLVCRGNKCISPSQVETAPIGSCLGEGQSCQGGRGYADPTCGGRNVRCGTSPVANGSVRCSANGSYVEERINGEWQVKEMCAGSCNSATNSCQLSVSDQAIIAPEQLNSAIVSGDPLSLAQDPMMAATFQVERSEALERCMQIGRTQAECEQEIQEILETGSQTGDTCIAYGLLQNASKSIETLRAECNEARGNAVLLATAAYGTTYAPQAVQTLTTTLANPYVQTGLRAGNVALNAYQTNQACANPQTPEEQRYCNEQQVFLGLAVAEAAFGIPGAHGLVQGSTTLGNVLRVGSALTSTAEIGANVYQTGQVCLGENVDRNLCLLQAGITGLHGVSVVPEIRSTGAWAGSQFNNYVASSVPDFSLGFGAVDNVRPINDTMLVNINDTIIRRMNDPDSLLAEYVTGLNPVFEADQLAARLLEDQAIIRTRYNLPPIEMRLEDPIEYTRRLSQIAANEGITIKPYSEYEQFFNSNMASGVYNDVENFIVVKPRTMGTPFENLVSEATTLEHELIHGLQRRYYPSLPIEGREYEAYLTNLKPDTLNFYQEQTERAGNIFGYFGVGGSTDFWYRSQGLTPSWQMGSP